MGCKCAERKAETLTERCTDPVEESFRLAFLRESQKCAKLASEGQYWFGKYNQLGDQAKTALAEMNQVLKKAEDQLVKVDQFLKQNHPNIHQKILEIINFNTTPRVR